MSKKYPITTRKKIASAEVPTPATDEVSTFFDISDGLLKKKLDDGSVVILDNIYLEFLFQEIDTADATHYYLGYLRTNGNWRIKRVTKANYTVAYATGSNDYSTNWTNRTTLTYS